MLKSMHAADVIYGKNHFEDPKLKSGPRELMEFQCPLPPPPPPNKRPLVTAALI